MRGIIETDSSCVWQRIPETISSSNCLRHKRCVAVAQCLESPQVVPVARASESQPLLQELEGVRTECGASRSVCERLGIECALKACDECQTYATLQLSCCGNFVCEPCVQAYNKSLASDYVQTPGTLTMLRCFS